jgi:hypothetical protein
VSAFEDAVIQRIKQLEREVERLQKWERPIVITDHGNLGGLGDNDHPQYLLTTGKAADSDKLDGLDSTAFVQISDLGVWSAWTPTQTGWTALPAGVYRYCKIGKLVMGIIYMSDGTSNSTAAELSLPFTAASNYSSMRGTTGWAMDNSVIQTQPGTWVVGTGATVIKLYKTFPEGAWTASGTKRIITVFFYEAP